MRYIKLEASARQALEKIHRTHAKSHVRQRAQCLLLSNKGYNVPELARFFSTRTHTFRGWFNRWESEGVQGLEIRPGRGLKPSISDENTALIASIKEEVKVNPHNMREVVEKLNERWCTTLTVGQVKTFLKKN
jgi:transposase